MNFINKRKFKQTKPKRKLRMEDLSDSENDDLILNDSEDEIIQPIRIRKKKIIKIKPSFKKLRIIKTIQPSLHLDLIEEKKDEDEDSEDEVIGEIDNTIGKFQLEININNKELVDYKNTLPKGRFLIYENSTQTPTNIIIWEQHYETYHIDRTYNRKTGELIKESLDIFTSTNNTNHIILGKIDNPYEFKDYQNLEKDDMIFLMGFRDETITKRDFRIRELNTEIWKLEKTKSWLWSQVHKIGFSYDRVNGGLMRN